MGKAVDVAKAGRRALVVWLLAVVAALALMMAIGQRSNPLIGGGSGRSTSAQELAGGEAAVASSIEPTGTNRVPIRVAIVRARATDRCAFVGRVPIAVAIGCDRVPHAR